MNQHLFDIGYCGYCATPREDWEKNHVAKCKEAHRKYVDSKNPTVQLKRIADALEKKS